MILIAYDGTPAADHAIAVAGGLLGGGDARVVHVWQPVGGPQDGPGLALPPAAVPTDDELHDQEAQARGMAEAGAELARAAGFRAEGAAIRGAGSSARALESEIDRVRPALVVVGSRGLTGLKAVLESSVARHVGAHAKAPVLIVRCEPAA
jgi:nucleotide-binding universal stress UspA family protein